MNTLRFAHQFFHFSLPAWHKFWNGRAPGPRDLARLFQGETFPARALRCGPVRNLAEAEAEFARVMERESRAGVLTVPVDSPAYPKALSLYIPPERLPPFLYVRGAPAPEEKAVVGIVGTRYPSELGQEAARDFSAYFTMLGVHVVSGLAKGVDALAHRENLKVGTVAVVGSDVLDIYPRENAALAEEITERGTLLSPFPLGQVPLPHNFPQRNQIIAGLTTGVIVVEGNETSGAAITAKQTLEMGKPVVALAQDFRSGFGRGAIRLQQSGATFVTCEEEALRALFARWGGFGEAPVALRARKRSFSFADFLQASRTDAAAAVVLLEEGISTGRIEKIGPERYRLRS